MMPDASAPATNKDLIFQAVAAVRALEGLESKDKHTKSVTANVIKYLQQDLRLLAHNYKITRDEFMEALR